MPDYELVLRVIVLDVEESDMERACEGVAENFNTTLQLEHAFHGSNDKERGQTKLVSVKYDRVYGI
jgi:hypothetical protein